MKNVLALSAPYLTFSTVTLLLKTMFVDSVNKQADGLFGTLVVNSSAPHLYTLFFIVTPTFSNMKAITAGLIIALVVKILILIGGGTRIYAVSTLLLNEILFVLGMSICVFNVQLKGRKVQGTVLGVLFIILSIVLYIAEASAFLSQ